MCADKQRTLSIVIPALNEEKAIGGTIQRCLDARQHIIENSSVTQVEVIMVSDGSTDRTEEIARSFDEVTVLVFEKNRGYGAAIKCGFAHASGDLVSFLDGDGTCDPRVFADLCRAIDEEDAHVVLGSRLGPDSEMPWIRTLGNTIFAWILGLLSKHSVGDTASGMRVIRRSCLKDLYPLPDGLHFTPAMSARILLEDKLKLVEVPMPYSERVGKSKLSVLKDGVRFLLVIARAAMCYRPSRPLLLIALALSVASGLLALFPLIFYVSNGRLEEWMIYRILLSALLLTWVGLLICASVIAEWIAASILDRKPASRGVTGVLIKAFRPEGRWAAIGLLTICAVTLVWPGIAEYRATGHVTMHWSRMVISSLLLVFVAMIGLTGLLLRMLELLRAQASKRASLVFTPDRSRPAEPPDPRIHAMH